MTGELTANEGIDRIEAMMAEHPPAVFPVEHRFTPGLYIRITTLPKGTMLTSMIHKTRHPFVITEGVVRVTSGNEGEVVYRAPYHGITEPGTRRILFAEETTVWATYHVTKETDLEKIAEQILEPRVNPLLPEGKGNQWREGACLG